MIRVHADRVSGQASTDYPGNLSGQDGSWDLEKFKKGFSVKIHNLTDLSSNFDLIGIDTSLANAFRRIMIAEVPSVAIEKVYISMNTSVIQDEVLASRLGLVPLQMSPDWLDWVDPSLDPHDSESYNDHNTVVFKLDVKCERNPDAPADATDPNVLYKNSNVYAKDLKFVPEGNQVEFMNPPPTVCNPDILLCKLRPGQEISLVCFAVLGIGSDHAKFSPVATASYRLMPNIEITSPIEPQDVEKFVKCFPPGVIEVDSDNRPYVADARRDTVSREVLRHPEFADKVKLGRVRDHFIFNVQSTGAMEPDEIFVKSVSHLRNKAKELLECEF